jgi:hypothetical protein
MHVFFHSPQFALIAHNALGFIPSKIFLDICKRIPDTKSQFNQLNESKTMHQTINRSQFHDAFHKAGRGDQFSYDALNALFSAFEEMEDATGVPIELDVIAICCDYVEDGWQNIAENYSIDAEGPTDVRDFLERHTQIVNEPFEGVFVYQGF